MNKNLDKAVTARFSLKDHTTLVCEAEARGCSVADVVRTSWRQYQQQKQLQQLLLRMEQRQRKDYFKILCTVLNLSEEEIEEADNLLKSRGVKL